MQTSPAGLSKSWQVIVIGGGPAGSTTARYLAQRGVKVLVIDGRKSIGSPLQCGELTPTNSELAFLCPDVPDIDGLFVTPEHVISRFTDEMHIVSPSGKKLKFPFAGQILNRVAHDEALVKLAISEGAQYLVGNRVIKVDGEEVHLKDGSVFQAKIIVGAGGHQDPLRRNYWSEKSLNIPVKFHLIDGEFTDAVELHFGSTAPGGYAWVIPKKEGANVGVGIQKKYAKKRTLNQCTEEFASRFSGQITFSGAGALPMSGSIKRFVKGNYVLVGDAAGMVLPSNGAGITVAMIGGRIAANAIASNLQNGTPLSQYEEEWKRQMGKVMRNSKRAFGIGSLMFRAPDWLLNLGFNWLTRPFIRRAITCRKIFWLF
ncbi:MAG: NAD(P)/FAD-dependent oxidoreductase [Euryarchaeota archaeon]|jgi:digeranylgeranylglycerophospholipid reductase|nr:NAD(P)/FAD-dependent oxidoreductase [Euryarchaeota archaeon]MBT3971631.1 NAD(P)/FAD-dependent oxidoreductase [Euryarchaeota archaeon]MBT6645748.1 NAD(P)/FAD-dependent oxidoreductase [Euryarchaeota archaeon]